MQNNLNRPRSKGRYKRPFDLGLLLLSHLLFLPFWIVLWVSIPLLIVQCDGRPVFYRQKRAGLDGRSFTMLKFRTMDVGSDRDGPSWTVEGDQRISGIGKILRKTAMDELPSLLSIWRGDMTFVGPRALSVEEQSLLENQIPGFGKRLEVLPGLTGLAQVYDKFDIAEDKLRYDLEYICKMSLWLDVKILSLSGMNTILAKWDSRGGKGTE